MVSTIEFEQDIERKLANQDARRPFMEGFDTVFDMAFFGPTEAGVAKDIRLSRLGVFSPHEPVAGTQPVASYSIMHIKHEQGYIGQIDAIRFASGARAAYKALGGYDNV